jgi:heme-binding NEAT domain protein
MHLPVDATGTTGSTSWNTSDNAVEEAQEEPKGQRIDQSAFFDIDLTENCSNCDRVFEKMKKKQACLNGKKKSRGRRHTEKIINQFAMKALIMGEGKCYEVLSVNSEGALPSRRTVDIKIYDVSLNEGEVNTKFLLQVLKQHNLPFLVSLAKDAISIVGLREYDNDSDRCF